MPNIGDQNIGNLNILLKQKNNKPITLTFYNRIDGVKVPIDLTQYTAIKMDVKTKVDISLDAFISWTVGYGLTISGTDNNVLSFEFTDEFVPTQLDIWYYDILFTDVDDNETLVGGTIKVRPVVTG